METKDWITILLSLGAFVFSVLNFRRNRRFDNQNHIFKLKIDAYSKILAEINNLVNVLQSSETLARDHIANPRNDSEDILIAKSDEIDKLCYDFDDFVICNSLVIPELIIIPLNALCIKILNSEYIDGESEDLARDMAELEKFVAEITIDANNIAVLLRKDLHIDRLNTDLYKRLK